MEGTVTGREWCDDSNTMPRGSMSTLIIQPLEREAILIRPIAASFYEKFNVHWSRTQIPLIKSWLLIMP